MKYKDEQIDDILSCYYRVESQSYVLKKYKITADTLKKHLKNPFFSKKLVIKRIENRNKLLKYKAIWDFYNTNGRELTIVEFKLKRKSFDNRIKDISKAVFYNQINYKRIVREFEYCLSEFEKIYENIPDPSTLDYIIKLNRYLMLSDLEIKEKYNLKHL